MSMNSEYSARMEKQLKQWDAAVDALATEGEKANVQARAAYLARVKELRTGRDAAQKTFQEFRAATEKAGAGMQAGMEAAWESMQKALKKASADLRK